MYEVNMCFKNENYTIVNFDTEPYENFEEYKRFKEWDKLCRQLEQHVTNKWKDPKVENTIAWIHNQYFNKYYN